jgi:putative inorganic carbon (hco3(-)) transporter
LLSDGVNRLMAVAVNRAAARLGHAIGPVLGGAAVALYAALLWLPAGADIGLYVLVASALWLGFAARSVPLGAAGADPWAGLLLASMAFATVASSDWQRSLALSIGLLPAALCYLLLTRYTMRGQAIGLVYLGLAVTTLALGVILLWIALVPGGMNASGLDAQSVVDAARLPLLVVPNDVTLAALGVPLTCAAMLIWRRPAVIALGGLSIAAGLVAIVLLQSRVALLSVFVGCFAMLIALLTAGGCGRRAAGSRWAWWPALVLLAALALAVVVTDAALGFPLARKFVSFCNNRDALWAAAWALFTERPLLGHGPHTFKALYVDFLPATGWFGCAFSDTRVMPWPHNLYLELLAGGGLTVGVAFTALLVWTAVALRVALRNATRDCRVLAAGLAGSFCAFLFAALFELSFIRFWVVVWLAILIAATAVLRRCAAAAPE